MIKNIINYLIKGVIYSIVFAAIGSVFSLLKGWQLLKGAYIFVLGAGIITMIISVLLLIGTPKIRKKYFVREKKEDFDDPIRGGEGIGPALMGVMMMVIGFLLEALMH
ncbi:hypothetical protein [Maledivibacter halophilus]|uniref:Uncharacterized protein n=1 Tax=Maledivibacter halophilus TaxID=36842 RepID=A0A1T5MSS3_9FIRM|nr:hypothetical protein [Maledivibacter halophilus]SKC91232.1 hypothetical protein SAMN02194393_05290 [Maledivibacter halophilus]